MPDTITTITLENKTNDIMLKFIADIEKIKLGKRFMISESYLRSTLLKRTEVFFHAMNKLGTKEFGNFFRTAKFNYHNAETKEKYQEVSNYLVALVVNKYSASDLLRYFFPGDLSAKESSPVYNDDSLRISHWFQLIGYWLRQLWGSPVYKTGNSELMGAIYNIKRLFENREGRDSLENYSHHLSFSGGNTLKDSLDIVVEKIGATPIGPSMQNIELKNFNSVQEYLEAIGNNELLEQQKTLTQEKENLESGSTNLKEERVSLNEQQESFDKKKAKWEQASQTRENELKETQSKQETAEQKLKETQFQLEIAEETLEETQFKLEIAEQKLKETQSNQKIAEQKLNQTQLQLDQSEESTLNNVHDNPAVEITLEAIKNLFVKKFTDETTGLITVDLNALGAQLKEELKSSRSQFQRQASQDSNDLYPWEDDGWDTDSNAAEDEPDGRIPKQEESVKFAFSSNQQENLMNNIKACLLDLKTLSKIGIIQAIRDSLRLLQTANSLQTNAHETSDTSLLSTATRPQTNEHVISLKNENQAASSSYKKPKDKVSPLNPSWWFGNSKKSKDTKSQADNSSPNIEQISPKHYN